MKKILILFACYFHSLVVFSQQQQLSLIPGPVNAVLQKGVYQLPKKIVIAAPVQPGVEWAASCLQQKLSTSTGYPVQILPSAEAAAIQMKLNKKYDTTTGKEGYRLAVSAKGISISANEPAGLFYGVQTLLQLLPVSIESNGVVKATSWTVPFVDITDYPRFAWRGLMLDVSRHFFTKEEVKKFIDEMARYKFNLFHWHLTDDEGWRIQIKSLPRLTEVGAWNAKRVGHFGDFSPIADDEPRNYGGFYTQDDIREVVQYAKEHFVSVLPEIEMPGHSMAAIASYPELSCTDSAGTYKVISGEKFIEWPAKGHFYGLKDNTLCPANDNVYPFVDKVIAEVSALFPFDYIHVGGDECIQNYWEKSEAVKTLMQKEGLHTMMEVQGYFENKVEKIVNRYGKKMIGWDEVLETGVSPTAAIMSWRGTRGGVEASNKGHEVVMSPTTYAYLDYMQSDEVMEPKVYASLRLSKTYSYEPLSEGINAKLVKGVQGNLWTEQVYNFRQVQYMTWPRAFAISEIAWSPEAEKNWPNFVRRVEAQFKRFDAAEIKYAPGMYDPSFKVSVNEEGGLVVELATEIDDLDIYYSFDNSYPDHFYPKYTAPLTVPVDATLLRVITYRGKQPVGRMVNMPVAELRKRASRK